MFGIDLVTLLAVLFGISEALALIPEIKSNSVFQFIANLLVKIKEVLTPKAPK